MITNLRMELFQALPGGGLLPPGDQRDPRQRGEEQLRDAEWVGRHLRPVQQVLALPHDDVQPEEAAAGARVGAGDLQLLVRRHRGRGHRRPLSPGLLPHRGTRGGGGRGYGGAAAGGEAETQVRGAPRGGAAGAGGQLRHLDVAADRGRQDGAAGAVPLAGQPRLHPGGAGGARVQVWRHPHR